eukprot:8621166-Pyramimonas_sp.AAC.1
MKRALRPCSPAPPASSRRAGPMRGTLHVSRLAGFQSPRRPGPLANWRWEVSRATPDNDFKGEAS